MPCMPATNTKSPALTPRLHVPSALMAPGGSSVLTPFGEVDCARPRPGARASAVRNSNAARVIIQASIRFHHQAFARRALVQRQIDRARHATRAAATLDEFGTGHRIDANVMLLDQGNNPRTQIVADDAAVAYAEKIAGLQIDRLFRRRVDD